MRSGFCSIVGRPNVGKSTLLNAMVGERIAITTAVPQTTRHAIRGVLHRPATAADGADGADEHEHQHASERDAVQVVFTDTPGLHKPRTLLGTRLNDLARSSLSSVDCAVFVVDGSRGAAGIGRGDAFVAGLLAELPTPVIAVLNKVDRTSRAAQLPALARLAELGDWAEVVPVSALTGESVATLVDLIVARMPEGPPYFPEGQVTDQTVEQRVAEAIREHAIGELRDEVPHSIAVVVDEIVPGGADGERDDVAVVVARLLVERDSQKGIVIGRGGQGLRRVGTAARPTVELLLGRRVYLDLRVTTAKEWQRDPRQLQRLGY